MKNIRRTIFLMVPLFIGLMTTVNAKPKDCLPKRVDCGYSNHLFGKWVKVGSLFEGRKIKMCPGDIPHCGPCDFGTADLDDMCQPLCPARKKCSSKFK